MAHEEVMSMAQAVSWLAGLALEGGVEGAQHS